MSNDTKYLFMYSSKNDSTVSWNESEVVYLDNINLISAKVHLPNNTPNSKRVFPSLDIKSSVFISCQTISKNKASKF